MHKKKLKIGATLYATPPGFHLFFCDGSRGSVASPLHHRAIVWCPSGARELGGRVPAEPVFAARAIARATTPWQGR